MSSITPDQYGPWALIAGGSEGIGLCFARELASAGFNLLLLARRPDPLQAAREQLSIEFPVEIRTHALDLTATDVAREGLQQLPHGPLHVAGEGNRMAASVLRGDDRRQSIAMMSDEVH